jgi:LysM repeat protein
MMQNDNDRMDKFNADPNDADYNEQYSLWKENRKVKLGTNSRKIFEKIPLSKLGISFLILLILLLLLFARNKIIEYENRIGVLENRVKSVEEKGIKLDAMDDGMVQIGEQSQTIEQLNARLDRSETALTLRMDEISKNFEKLEKQMADNEIQKAKSSKAVKAAKVSKSTAKNRYHIVKSGETLYSISRRYGVAVKALRMINKLGDGGVIHPGQKLVVSP